ncbi:MULTISPECIES: ABC transporter substrate-binding protein [unclassified Massilia]|uniref:ABC transporter substrate-binding protein n=1 Tax=unclassified Massilia TaxID=2609279 RepID=UPI0017861622|nr:MULTISPECIES: ABC transporter substrate-binding protein [unclassified Massilia]MBD8528410.1 ABC transporter substrate-binding protein [Massilia sp. CFBP 13647]MBD8671968.1 ABC transporter substrate-binding protein [Massilia sp. CFBP 13721]
MKKASSIVLAIVAATGAATVQAEEFKVGVQIPLTGPLARVGMGTQEGIRVAAEVFNKTNGKHTIKLVTVDDESAPAKAVAAVEKLASEGVVAVTGGYGSNNISPASDAAGKLNLAYITSGGVDDGLVQAGRKNFFRINNTAGYQKALVGLISDLGVKSVSIIYSTKDATEGLATDVQKTLGAKGIKVGMHAFDPAITDFKPILNKVKLQDRSEFIAMVGYENDYVGILRAARVLKPTSVKAIAGVWSLATPKMAADFPDLMPKVYGTAVLPFPVNFTTPEGKAFGEGYKKLHNKEPDYLGQFGYVQSMLLFQAIARAADKGTIKNGGVIEEMRKTDAQTLIGRVQFNAGGDNPNFVQRMGQHQGKQVVLVWPKDSANGKPQFPGVPW